MKMILINLLYSTSRESVDGRILLSVKSPLSLFLVLDVESVWLPLSDVSVEESPPQPPVQDQDERHWNRNVYISVSVSGQ